MRTLVVCQSGLVENAQLIASAIAGVLAAPLVNPSDLQIGAMWEYDLIGFGSEIRFLRHHPSLLDIVDRFPEIKKKAFIFSTRRIAHLLPLHGCLKSKLVSKGFSIVGEFSCKGKPDAQDLNNARTFARGLLG